MLFTPLSRLQINFLLCKVCTFDSLKSYVSNDISFIMIRLVQKKTERQKELQENKILSSSSSAEGYFILVAHAVKIIVGEVQDFRLVKDTLCSESKRKIMHQ